jgi:stage II sporulation protein D
VISSEPTIRIGIIDHASRIDGEFNGQFTIMNRTATGPFTALVSSGEIVVTDAGGVEIVRGRDVYFTAAAGASFTLHGVTIGIHFHWERKESQTFCGDVRLILRSGGSMCVCNLIAVEEYLVSVISSEMSGTASPEFLKAHAMTSRSWLVAMLGRQAKNAGVPARRTVEKEGEIVRWYDREDHDLFDVCADDHCQRYQGITKIVSPAAADAVASTRGAFLVYGEAVCDARFSKSCGGISEAFENCWDDTRIPYLRPVVDSQEKHPLISGEPSAKNWICSSPDAFCNTSDVRILSQILPSVDRATSNFFRWSVGYSRAELETIIAQKSGMTFGSLKRLVPIERGPSGRITKLRIEGTENTIMVGKELEIRRWLSDTHLYSSAFVVETEDGRDGLPAKFRLRGAGWGHGVGLCQIGAAVMAERGFTAIQIVRHYFTGAEVRRLYA